jgi:hypothetical protein
MIIRHNIDLIFKPNFVELTLNNLGTKLYNKLPNYLKNLESLKHFKKQIKVFLLQQTFWWFQWMNTCPMCRHPEREFYGKVWH